MRAVLIDDEIPALENLKRKMSKIPDFEIVGIYNDERQALEEIIQLNPDIIFTDIEMRFMNGLEFLEKVFDLNIYPKIVFVTAYVKYAPEAFELNAFDYIRKPVETQRLLKTIEKVEFQKRVLLNSNGENNRKEIHCFGILKFLYNNKEVPIKWRTKKVEELFLYLLCNYDRYVSKEKLVEILWEDADISKGMQYLYNALYNLKKTEFNFFRIDTVQGKIRVSLDDTICDVIEIEKIYKRYRDVKEDKQRIKKEVQKLYKGILLEEYDYVWLPEYQRSFERIRRSFD